MENSSQCAFEHLMVKIRLQDFVADNSRGVEMLTKKFGDVPNQHELFSLARVLSSKLDIFLDREASRRKAVLLKWYDENVDKIQPYLEKYITIKDELIETPS